MVKIESIEKKRIELTDKLNEAKEAMLNAIGNYRTVKSDFCNFRDETFMSATGNKSSMKWNNSTYRNTQLFKGYSIYSLLVAVQEKEKAIKAEKTYQEQLKRQKISEKIANLEARLTALKKQL